MPPQYDFDVFLSHNSKDKTAARELKAALTAKGLAVWFDEDELRPGMPWQPLLQLGLEKAGSVVVALGASGYGPWQGEETQAAITLSHSKSRPVIPVFMPGCPESAVTGLFLGSRTWVDLRNGYSGDALSRLIWGITGEKSSVINSEEPPANPHATKWILVAGSGGETPRPKKMEELCARLGQELASTGFSLVTGGWDGVDHDVARAFAERIQDEGRALSGRLVQVMQEGATPDFPAGRLVSSGTDEDAWYSSVERADAVVLVGGLGGTWQTGDWAIELGKPVFPVADSRGPKGNHSDAYHFYFSTLERWPENPVSKHISSEDFEALANPSPKVVADLVRLLKIGLAVV